jgi:hypothetical protein
MRNTEGLLPLVPSQCTVIRTFHRDCRSHLLLQLLRTRSLYISLWRIKKCPLPPHTLHHVSVPLSGNSDFVLFLCVRKENFQKCAYHFAASVKWPTERGHLRHKTNCEAYPKIKIIATKTLSSRMKRRGLEKNADASEEAVGSCEMSVRFYQTTRRHVL